MGAVDMDPGFPGNPLRFDQRQDPGGEMSVQLGQGGRAGAEVAYTPRWLFLSSTLCCRHKDKSAR